MIFSNKRISRIAAGRKAQSFGERWEILFRNAAIRQGMVCIRIEDGCKTRGRRIIRVRQSFDFVLAAPGGESAFLDTKTCKTPNFSFSQQTRHQVIDLMALEKMGLKAGYCVYFQTSNEVVFFSASKLIGTLSRSSLKTTDGLLLGKELDFDLRKIFL